MQVKKMIGEENEDNVRAVPVYRSRRQYTAVTRQLMGHVAQLYVIEVILKRIFVPAVERNFEKQLDKIFRLRDRESFRESMINLRSWSRRIAAELANATDEETFKKILATAGRELDKWVNEYDEALNDAKMEKIQRGVISLVALGTGFGAFAAGGPLYALVGSAVEPLFSVRAHLKPCWKAVAEQDCFAAGVIYQAEQL